MRADAHRPAADEDGVPVCEVASSPDTPGRPERWRWHIRLREESPDGRAEVPSRQVVHLGLGPDTSLEVAVDPASVRAEVELVDLTDTYLVGRDERGLVVLVQGSGRCLVEGRHELGRHDTLVLEGDDPMSVGLVPTGTGPTTVAVVRLHPVEDNVLGWVP